MRADEAQAAVARCLVSSQWFGHSVEPGLPSALHLFRGFITRIKHTQLRRVVPLTLRLLAIYRLDIAFFAHLTPGYLAAREHAMVSTADLFERFERELGTWLAGSPAFSHNQVEAMLRHEARIWRAGRAAPYAEPSAHPRLLAGVAVERFPLDVLALAEAVTSDRFSAPATTPGDQFLLYRPHDGEVRIEGVDPLSAWLLSRLDGATPPAALVAELSSAMGVDTHGAVHDLLADAAARRLLDHAGV